MSAAEDCHSGTIFNAHLVFDSRDNKYNFLIFFYTKIILEYLYPQIYLTWTYDPSLDFGPQTDLKRSAEFMNSLSEEDIARFMSMQL